MCVTSNPRKRCTAAAAALSFRWRPAANIRAWRCRDIAATDRIGGDVKRAGKQAHEWLGNLEVVMGQVGHAHPDTTLRIYAKVLNRDRSGSAWRSTR